MKLNELTQRHGELQFKIWSRLCKQYDVNPILGLILVGFALLTVIGILDFKTSYAPYILMVIWSIGQWQLSGRDRNLFLRSVEGDQVYRLLRLLENTITSFPLLIYLLIRSEWMLCFIALIASLVLSFLIRKERNLARIMTPLSMIPIQFPYGVRTAGIGYVMMYALVGIAIAVDNSNLGLVAIGFIQLIPWLFLEKKEHPVLLWEHTIPPESFMALQAKRILIGYGLISVIPVLVFLFLYPQQYLYIMTIIALGLAGAYTLTAIKYTYYDDHVPLIIYFLFFGSCLIPPLLIGMGFYFYRRSILQLKLHVNNG